MSAVVPVLSQGVGYGVVLGIGIGLALLMAGLTWIQGRYTSIDKSNTAEFASASHSIKPGLIGAGIVSAWTWAATLLQSSSVAYRLGVSGPFWYAAGATVQVLLFSSNAIKLKQNAPYARTYLEIIRTRWGNVGHATFLFFGLATNIMVSSMLVCGGSSTVTALTGMSTYAAAMLIPVGVIIYVVIGGMRAALLADWIHTAVVYCILLAFGFTVYTTAEKIGSVGRMYELLVAEGARNPVPGNAGGSFLTMRSVSGLIFGIINLCGNFSTIYLDQSYWNRAIASQPVSCVTGFLLGGTAWLGVPLAFASTMGLAAVALRNSDPTFPFLAPGDISAGLPAPAAAAALMGASGAALILCLLFLAVVSSSAAELVAVSGILTFDIYVPYINPSASDKQTLRVNQLAILGYGIFMGILGVIFYSIGISMGWLYLFMGTLLGGGVAPVALCVMSSRANKWGCIAGAWTGLAVGVTAWLVTASTLNDGVLSIETTGADYPMLAGNLGSIGTSAIISFTTSYLWPAHYDFVGTHNLNAADHADEIKATLPIDEEMADGKVSDNKEDPGAVTTATPHSELEDSAPYDENKDPVKLAAAFRFSVIASLTALFVLIILIPLPLFFSQHIFPEKSFTVWIAFCIMWLFYGVGAVVLFPLWEARDSIGDILGSIWGEVSGKRKAGKA